MATQDNGINLFDQEPEQEKKGGKRTALMLGALAALGVVGALGVGFMLGGGASGNDGGVQSQKSEPTRVVRVSPTAADPQTGGQTQPQAPSGSTGSGGSGSGGEPPAPANTAEPPAPTETPVPPTDTPTETPTSTPTATATPSGGGCPWCPDDLDLIDPGVVIDVWPPIFNYANAMNCPEGTLIGASVNEDADVWVSYSFFGLFESESAQQFAEGPVIFNLGGGPAIFPAVDIVVHARDAAGNESSVDVNWMDCM
jgi:hypothetical protein